MRIWIDLGNSPHVPYFKVLGEEFRRRGHEILWTARDYSQTVELAEKTGLNPKVIGAHGGKSLIKKGWKYFTRVFLLRQWIKNKGVELAVSHNSHEPLAVARLLGIKSVTLMDYEHHPANHLSFRLANRVVVPKSFPEASIKKFGAESKTRTFDGIKEDVYLADFEPDSSFQAELATLGIKNDDILIVVRPHASEALYHRSFSNEVLGKLLDKFTQMKDAKIVLLPRTSKQGNQLRELHNDPNIIIPTRVLDGPNLLAAADLVISGGGTMNREAAALGIPAVTIFAGKRAAIDEYLENEGRMITIRSEQDIEQLEVRKKTVKPGRRELGTKAAVAELVLEKWKK